MPAETDAPVPGVPAVPPPGWEKHVRGIAAAELRWVDSVSVQLFVEEYDRRGAELAKWQEFLRPRDHSGDNPIDTPEAIQGRIDSETRRALAELSVARRRIDDLLAECDRRLLYDAAPARMTCREIQRYLRPEGEQT